MSLDSNGRASGLFYIETCEFKDVLPIWERELWPARKSAIETNSAMKWLGGIDMELMKAAPTFWLVSYALAKNAPKPQAVSEKVVGVLSGHFGGVIQGKRSYRTRGLWVSEEDRRSGAAKLLMTAAFEQATREACNLVWTFPRESSIRFYNSMGFKQVGAMIGTADPGAGEFGPNCFALAEI